MSNAKRIDICKLCGDKKELKLSHAIPSAFFKDLLGNTGKALVFDVNTKYTPEKIGNIVKDYLLCGECEQYLNNTFEKYIITLIKTGYLQRKNTIVTKKSYGNVFNFNDESLNGKNLINFVISILWRASLLEIDFYAKLNLPKDCLDWMRDLIYENKKPNSRLINIELNTLIDSSNQISSKNLKELIVSPFSFSLYPRPIIAMIFGGYLFKITIPNVKPSARKMQLSKNTKIYLAKNCELKSIYEMKKLFHK